MRLSPRVSELMRPLLARETRWAAFACRRPARPPARRLHWLRQEALCVSVHQRRAVASQAPRGIACPVCRTHARAAGGLLDRAGGTAGLGCHPGAPMRRPLLALAALLSSRTPFKQASGTNQCAYVDSTQFGCHFCLLDLGCWQGQQGGVQQELISKAVFWRAALQSSTSCC